MSDQAHREANTRRLRLYPWGSAEVGKDQRGNSLDFVVDRGFFKDLKEFHDDHKARGYYSPFAFAHKPGVDGPTEEAFVKALTPGLITDLGEDADGIWGDIYFAASVAKLYDDGLLSSVSPSHYTNFRNPHTGKVYRRGLREVSAIGVRHLKDLPTQSGYYQLAEGAAWTAITQLEESDMTTPKIEIVAPAALTAEDITKLITEGIKRGLEPITATVTTLGERIDALPKPVETTTQLSEVTQTAEQKQIKDLEARIADLDRKAKLAESRASLMVRLPGADAPLVTSLAEVMLAAPTHAETQIKALEAIHGVEAVKARGETITVLGEQGRQGGSEGRKTWDTAMIEAVKAGHKANSPGAIEYVCTRHPALVR